MNRLYVALLMAIFSCTAFYLAAQAQMDEIAGIQNLPVENIRLSTDREVYVVDEHIRFSVFLSAFDGRNPAPISNIVYVELFDHEQKSILRKKIPVNDAMAAGNMHLPGDIRTGNYYLRAFTQYSRNFLPAAYPVKRINVINPDYPVHSFNEKKQAISIFPEYGKIYRGIDNKVAFRFNNNTFIYSDSVFLLRNNVKSKLIRDIHLNYGNFTIKPEENVVYSLIIYKATGDSISLELPVHNLPEFLITHHTRPNSSAFIIYGKNKVDSIHLRLYSSNGYLLKKMDAVNENRQLLIENRDLTSGINYFVFTNGKDSALQTIPVFKEYPEPLEIPLNPTSKLFQPRDSVQVSIDWKKNLQATASVSVVKAGTVDHQEYLSPFILENIYLAKPSDFSKSTTLNQLNTARIIFAYRLLTGEHTISFPGANHRIWLPDIRDISLSGFVKEKSSGKPAENKTVVASLLFDNPQIHMMKTDKNGFFIFSFYDLYGTKDIFISLMDNTHKYEILVNNEFATELPGITNTYVPPDSSQSSFLEELFINAQINNIFHQHQAQKTPEAPDIFGNYITYVKPDQFISLPGLQDIFNEIIPYAKMRTGKNEVSFATYNTKTGIWNNNPLILLDNVPVNNPAILKDIHAAEVDKIGLVTNTYVIGDNFIPGIILIFTKSGQFAGTELSNNAVFIEYQMYSAEDKIKSPAYSTANSKQSSLPDFRNTLYWNPSLKITKDTSIQFYTSDHISDYKIRLTGITDDGRHIYGESLIRVEK